VTPTPDRCSWTLPLLALLLASCSDGKIEVFNATPEAEIRYPAEGDELLEDYDQTLLGRVSDVDNEFDELSIRWVLGTDAVLCEDSVPDEEGNISCVTQLESGATTLLLEVADLDGEQTEATVSFTVVPSEAPVVEILGPTGLYGHYTDQLTTFEGLVSDAEDAEDVLTAVWESSIDGVLDEVEAAPSAQGDVLGFGLLSEGEHEIWLTATDSTGKSTAATSTIQVGPPNSAPTCTLTSPLSGTVVAAGEPVLLEGTVDDVDVPSNWLAVEWESSIAGALGSSTPTLDGDVSLEEAGALTSGAHIIGMTVIDEAGGSCTDSITLVVNAPPQVDITAPADGSVVAENELVSFSAELSDEEDAAILLTLQWSSSLDGGLDDTLPDTDGMAAFSTDTLSRGEHTITLTVTDTQGASTEAALTLTVNAQPTVDSVMISSDGGPVSTRSVLTCSATASDPEGDIPTLSYAWSNTSSGAELDPGADDSTVTLSPSEVSPGDTVRCTATATDSLGGAGTNYDMEVVENTAPGAAEAAISPDEPTSVEHISCSVGTEATDADEETLSYSLSWTVDGVGSGYSSAGGDASAVLTVPASETAVDQVWTCSVTAVDATESGPAASTSVTILSPYVDCGDGTMGVPITSCEDLENMSNALTETYCLLGDVDCAGTADFTPIAGESVSFSDEDDFSGQLLGYDHTISNLSTTGDGLFQVLRGEVRDLNLADVSVVGSGTNVGGLAAEARGGVWIDSVAVTGWVESTEAEFSRVGGLVGQVGGVSAPDGPATLTNLSFDGTVTSDSVFASVGGVIGSANGLLLVASDWHATGTIESTARAGGLAGYMSTGGHPDYEGSLLSDCTFSGDVTGGDEVGGAVGSQGITLSNCTTSGTVTGVTEVGGMVGQGGTLMDCSSSADVSGEGSVGGLAGQAGLIERSFATGTVTATDNVAGGLVGVLKGYSSTGGSEGVITRDRVEQSYATGSVSATTNAGGLAGVVYSGEVVDCYATGEVSAGGYAGGLMGQTWALSHELGGSIQRSFSTGAVSYITRGGGFVGYDLGESYFEDGEWVYIPFSCTGCYWDIESSGTDTSDGGEGRTTTEMTTEATFVDWDFADTWTIDEGTSYPCLQWQGEDCPVP